VQKYISNYFHPSCSFDIVLTLPSDRESEMISKQLLDRGLVENATVGEKCVPFFQRSKESEEEFITKVEAFAVNNSIQTLSIANLASLEVYLHDYARKPSEALSKSVLGKRPGTSVPQMKLPSIKRLPAQTHATDNIVASSTAVEQSFSQSAGVSYGSRKGQGHIVCSYIPKQSPFSAESLPPPVAVPRRCQVICDHEDFANVPHPFRFMFTTLDERALALERHLLLLQERMCMAHGIVEDSLQPVGIPSQDIVWCCGRICSDNPDGRMNKESVLLEGSRKDSGGRRVSLDLREVTAPFSVFPGQIVLVEGINSSGRSFVVKRVIEGAAPPKKSDLSLQKEPLRIMAASGPFTTSENLHYEPLRDFLGMALRNKPDLIILTGPFVDISSPKLSDGNVYLQDDEGNSIPASYETVFIQQVVHFCLDAFYSDEDSEPPHTQIVLVPSLLDAHHEFVFPQPPFGDREVFKASFVNVELGRIDFPQPKDQKKRIHLLSNPCMLDVDGVRFGVCSNDVMFALSSDEVSHQLGSNRLPYLASHLIRQNSFCPQFPLPPSASGQLDWRQSRFWKMNSTPDFLLLPSKLTPFVKEYNGSLLLNPGFLSKGKSGGTYVDLYITKDSGDIASVSILEKAHVVVKKI
jgi:DNA polymerase alpha subunit B